MKITFLKNETHFYPRISYTWENAEKVNFTSEFQGLKKYSIMWLFLLPMPVFVIFCSQKIVKNYWFFVTFIAIIVLCLPLHELCHALFCWISGRKVERICFFPYKNLFFRPAAYVKPVFGAWNKKQAIFLILFPFILLSFVPAILAIFISNLRFWLLFLSLLNISVSGIDIIDALYLSGLPKNCLYFFDGFALTVKDNDKPIIIHQLSITPELDKVNHRCFEYFNGRLTEKHQVHESAEVTKLRLEFVQQFNLEP